MSNPQNKAPKTNFGLQIPPQKVNVNQLNSSSSKMQYSIPKSSRFSAKQTNFSPDKFYQLPDTKSKRSTSLGYGNKVDIGKKSFQAPSPSLYNIRSQFNNEKKKGITISAGRQIIKNNSMFDSPKWALGPGNYNPKDPNLQPKKNQGYSIGKRSIDLSQKWKLGVPGPGNYETIELLDKNLKSKNSKVQNVRTAKFSKSKRVSDFEQSKSLKNPGPGQYVTNIQKTAKFKTKGGYHFSHKQRDGIIQKSKTPVPGPGSYQKFSQFLH